MEKHLSFNLQKKIETKNLLVDLTLDSVSVCVLSSSGLRLFRYGRTVVPLNWCGKKSVRNTISNKEQKEKEEENNSLSDGSPLSLVVCVCV